MVSLSVSKSMHQMDHSQEDPADTIRKSVGDIDKMTLTGVQVLIGTYVRPKQTKGGILLTDNQRDEDMYQGKVGLVLKVAPGAFEDGPDAKFYGYKAKVGDWVFYRGADSWSLTVNGQHCRILEDVHVRGGVPGPDMIL